MADSMPAEHPAFHIPKGWAIDLCQDHIQSTALRAARSYGIQGVLTFYTATVVHTALDLAVSLDHDTARKILRAALEQVDLHEALSAGQAPAAQAH